MNKYQDIKNKLKSHGLELLVEEKDFNGTNEKYFVQCSNNHIFTPRINDLLHRKIHRPSKGCSQCAEKILLEESYKVALSNLLPEHTIVDTYIKQTKQKDNRKIRFYSINCPFGHIYEKMTSSLANGCPECTKKTFVGQERTRIVFQKQFNQLFPSVRPDWLKNPKTGRNLELDGYCEELKLAFEYQGRQHKDEDTEFASDYINQIERDEYKKQICLENGINLILIHQPRFYEAEKFLKSIVKDCSEQGVAITIGLEDANFNIINDSNTLTKNYEVFKDFANEKGYTLISKGFSTMEDVLEFSCSKGHSFNMKGSFFKTMLNTDKYRNEPCLECHKMASPEQVKTDLSIIQCQEFAKQIGYECISTSYTNINTLLNWKCNHGHVFSKTYRQMIRNQTGKYCPHCTQLGLEQAKSMYKVKAIKDNEASKVTKSANGEVRDLYWLLDFVKDNNVKLVENKYLGMDLKHDFICDKGHSFSSTISNLMDKQKRGTKFCTHKECNGITTIDLEACQDFALEQGWECLSLEYKNVNEKMQWKCDKGHIFEKSFRQFQRSKTGINCPCC